LPGAVISTTRCVAGNAAVVMGRSVSKTLRRNRLV
jgi:hypothetical protein